MFYSFHSARLRRTRGRSLGFDGLESRALLAGNVMVQLLQGSVIVQGDVASNAIKIDQAGLAANQLRITGIDNTTIKGQTDPVVVKVTKDLLIDLGGGGDEVSLEGIVMAHNVSITTGNGTSTADNGVANDVAVHHSSIGGNLTITTGTGTSTGTNSTGNAVYIDSTDIGRDLTITTGDGTGTGVRGTGNDVEVDTGSIGRDLTITTGDGTATGNPLFVGDTVGNYISVFSIDIGRDLTITTGTGTATGVGGTGNDVAVYSGSIGRDLTITTGDGTFGGDSNSEGKTCNQVSVYCSIGRDLTITTGDGISTSSDVIGNGVILTGSIGRNLTVTTGDGTARIILEGLTVQALSTVQTGQSDDNFVVLDSTFLGLATFDGGGGTNKLDLGGNVFAVPPIIKNLEVI
jgi:hypothetical protein